MAKNMKASRKYWTFLSVALTALLIQCHPKRPTGTRASDKAFQISYGIMLYDGRPFNGTQLTSLGDSWRETPYVDGKIEGLEIEYFADGRIAAKRPYVNNQRVGIHREWYRSGKSRAYYEYKNGLMDGEAFTWFEDGHLSTYAQYKNGRQIGQKTWRSTGKIYANYVIVKDKKLMGLRGSDLCNGVKSNDKGETIDYDL